MRIGKTKFEKEHNRVRSQLADDKGDPQSWSCQGQAIEINAKSTESI